MTLPPVLEVDTAAQMHDYAACSDCRRRDPGRAEWQTCIEPPIKDGRCEAYIPPVWRTTKAVQR